MKNYPLPSKISWWRLPEWLDKLTTRVEVLEDAPAPPTPSTDYKLYTALLTQSGDDNPDSTYSGDLVIGRTYQIFDLGGAAGYDFTNVGAPNNNIDTWFVATGTTPNSWGTNVCLNYNSGAPVVTVLENTIGNIWCEYVGAGTYQIKCDNLFTADKTTIAHKSLTSWANGISSETHDPSIFNILTFKMDDGNAGDGLLNKTPIEIRVYN